MRVGYNITIRTYIEYDAGEDDAIGNNKSPEQLIAEVKAMSKDDVLDVLQNVRGLVVDPYEDVTVEYFEIDDSPDISHLEDEAT